MTGHYLSLMEDDIGTEIGIERGVEVGEEIEAEAPNGAGVGKETVIEEEAVQGVVGEEVIGGIEI
jgi:hypothetical protein